MPSIFISYRRGDSPGYAGRLYDRLRGDFGKDNVFLDVDAIPPGDDFVEKITEKLDECDLMLVIIGRRWLGAVDEQNRPRLQDKRDYVRIEIQTALSRQVRTIPVLVEGAAMPRAQDLPEPLKAFAHRQAIELSDTRWDYDIRMLINSVRGGPTGLVTPAKPAPTRTVGGARTRRRNSTSPAPRPALDRLVLFLSLAVLISAVLGAVLMRAGLHTLTVGLCLMVMIQLLGDELRYGMLIIAGALLYLLGGILDPLVSVTVRHYLYALDAAAYACWVKAFRSWGVTRVSPWVVLYIAVVIGILVLQVQARASALAGLEAITLGVAAWSALKAWRHAGASGLLWAVAGTAILLGQQLYLWAVLADSDLTTEVMRRHSQARSILIALGFWLIAMSVRARPVNGRSSL